ncbi:MAG: hypothetical protein HQK72_04130 [Desulfamplus sp.]|nr:hypothetical protein [Desulfamplus sp.]
MQKARMNLTIDADLIQFINEYAESQRTTVSEVFTQFALRLKLLKENDVTEKIIADKDFYDALLVTMEKIKSGTMRWHTYDEVFE